MRASTLPHPEPDNLGNVMDDARISTRILKGYMWGIICVMTLFAVPLIGNATDKVQTAFGMGIPLAFCLSSLLMIRLGWIRLAAHLVALGPWVVVCVLMIFSGGLRSYDGILLAPTLVATGLILGMRTALLASACTLAYLVALYLWGDMLPLSKSNFPAPVLVMIYAVCFLLLLVPLRIAIRSLHTLIGETRQALLNRRLAEEKLRESEAQLRAVVESIDGAVFVLDPGSGSILQSNHNATTLLGYDQQELAARSLPSLACTEQGRLALHMQKAISEGPQTIELEACLKGGKGLWVEIVLTKTIIRSRVHVLAIIRNISARLELERRLIHSQKMEAMGTLAGGVAHDFNNILCAIMGYTEMARMDAEGQTELCENLDQVIQSSSRARDLVRQILTFSRRSQPEAKLISVAELMQEALRLLRPALPSSIEIRLEMGADLPRIMADPSQVHQVIMNLVTNAAHALRTTQTPVLTLRCRIQDAPAEVAACTPTLAPGLTLMIEVADNGHGMDEATQAHIFEPFFTTKPQGEGTGLGLAVVHGIVRANRGGIHVESAPEKGASFQVYFPTVHNHVPANTETAATHFEGRGERVLFVDDEVSLCDYMRRLLTRLRLEVVTESDAKAALTRLRTGETFDLVISDLTMPQVNGLQLAEELRRGGTRTPFVLASGLVNANLQGELSRLGITQVMPKPYTPATVAAMLARVLPLKGLASVPHPGKTPAVDVGGRN